MTGKKRLVRGNAILILAGALAAFAGGGHEQTFKGEIADSQCALNVHSLSRSHKEMLKTKAMGSTAADCARYCAQHFGGVFVLQVQDKVYKLDNQELAEKNAGMKVKLTGILDLASNMIQVHSIEQIH